MSMQRDLLRARRRDSVSSPSPLQSIPGQPAKSPASPVMNTPGEAVRVAVRVRPPFNNESSQPVIVAMDPSSNTVSVEDRMEEKQVFFVDMPLWSCHGTALDGSSPVTQSVLYEQVGRPLLHHALEGFNSTLMAYGQTGSGKTYTMVGEIGQVVGDNDDNEDVLNDSEEGIIPRLCRDMFQNFRDRSFKTPSGETMSWEVCVSFVEVYCEKISDLLDHGKVVSLRDEVIDNETYFSLVGARRVQATNVGDVLQALRIGNRYRKTASTSVNERSSRSHAFFILDLTEVISFSDPDGETVRIPNKHLTIRLVDLAGSERLGETGILGQKFKEGVEINLSLFTLGMVIESLTDFKRRGIRPPYRESTLTKLLKDAFGGNSKTTMICTIAPTAAHRSQTLQTLQYGSKARRVVNKPRVEEDPATVTIRKVSDEVLSLRKQLSEAKCGSKHHDSILQQLALVNERLRREQEISRRRKSFLRQKEEELELRYREMEEQRQAYDSRVRELGAEVERTKVKQKERERELYRACRRAEAVAEESQKEMELQRVSLQNHLQQKSEEILHKQREVEERLKQLEGTLREHMSRPLQSVQNVEKRPRKKDVSVAEWEDKMTQKTACCDEELRSKFLEVKSMTEELQAEVGVAAVDARSRMPEDQREVKRRVRELKEGAPQAKNDGRLQENDTKKKHGDNMDILCKKEELLQHREEKLLDLERRLSERAAKQEMQIRLKEKELIGKMKQLEQRSSRVCRATQCEPEELQQALNYVSSEGTRQVEGNSNGTEANQSRRQLKGGLDECEALLQRQRADTETRERELDQQQKQKQQGQQEPEENLLNSQFDKRVMTDIFSETFLRSEVATMLEAGLQPCHALINVSAKDSTACQQLGKEALKRCLSRDVESSEDKVCAVLMAHEDVESCFIRNQLQQEAREPKLIQHVMETENVHLNKEDMCAVHFNWVQQMFAEVEGRCRELLEALQNCERDLMKRSALDASVSYKNDNLAVAINSMQSVGIFASCLEEPPLCGKDLVAEDARLTQRNFPFCQQLQPKEGAPRKDEEVEAHLPQSSINDREKVTADCLTEERAAAVCEELPKRELEVGVCVGHAQTALVEGAATHETEGLALLEAIERECIERVCRLQIELHLCRDASEGSLESARKLFHMKEDELHKEEEQLKCRVPQLKGDGADRQKSIICHKHQISMNSFTRGKEEEEDVCSTKHTKEGECHLREELRQREMTLKGMSLCFLREMQERERNLQQAEEQLRQQLTQTGQRMQKRIADLERRRHEVASVVEDNERTLRGREGELQAQLAKNKEVEKQIQQRDVELKRQRLHHVDLRKLLEDRERLLRREHAHRISGKQSATQLTHDLLESNEFLKQQLEAWIQKYNVLKTDERVECERCSWQNRRDADVCVCCGNTQLV